MKKSIKSILAATLSVLAVSLLSISLIKIDNIEKFSIFGDTIIKTEEYNKKPSESKESENLNKGIIDETAKKEQPSVEFIKPIEEKTQTQTVLKKSKDPEKSRQSIIYSKSKDLQQDSQTYSASYKQKDEDDEVVRERFGNSINSMEKNKNDNDSPAQTALSSDASKQLQKLHDKIEQNKTDQPHKILSEEHSNDHQDEIEKEADKMSSKLRNRLKNKKNNERKTDK